MTHLLGSGLFTRFVLPSRFSLFRVLDDADAERSDDPMASGAFTQVRGTAMERLPIAPPVGAADRREREQRDEAASLTRARSDPAAFAPSIRSTSIRSTAIATAALAAGKRPRTRRVSFSSERCARCRRFAAGRFGPGCSLSPTTRSPMRTADGAQSRRGRGTRSRSPIPPRRRSRSCCWRMSDGG